MGTSNRMNHSPVSDSDPDLGQRLLQQHPQQRHQRQVVCVHQSLRSNYAGANNRMNAARPCMIILSVWIIRLLTVFLDILPTLLIGYLNYGIWKQRKYSQLDAAEDYDIELTYFNRVPFPPPHVSITLILFLWFVLKSIIVMSGPCQMLLLSSSQSQGRRNDERYCCCCCINRWYVSVLYLSIIHIQSLITSCFYMLIGIGYTVIAWNWTKLPKTYVAQYLLRYSHRLGINERVLHKYLLPYVSSPLKYIHYFWLAILVWLVMEYTRSQLIDSYRYYLIYRNEFIESNYDNTVMNNHSNNGRSIIGVTHNIAMGCNENLHEPLLLVHNISSSNNHDEEDPRQPVAMSDATGTNVKQG